MAVCLYGYVLPAESASLFFRCSLSFYRAVTFFDTPQDTILVMASWLLLGLCGVPVFSGGSAGPGKLLGPSGGYYIGFLVVAFLISLFCRKWKNVAFQTAFLIVVGIPVIYAFGAGWMKHVTGQPWGAVIVQSIIPFIPLDIVKCVAAVALGKALKRTGLFGN